MSLKRKANKTYNKLNSSSIYPKVSNMSLRNKQAESSVPAASSSAADG